MLFGAVRLGRVPMASSVLRPDPSWVADMGEAAAVCSGVLLRSLRARQWSSVA